MGTTAPADFIEHSTRVRVRFSEIDSLHIAWHGHYAKYLEDAREGFARAHGLTHDAIRTAGYVAPMTKLSVEYLSPAREGDELDVTARLQRNRAAKLHFTYEVRNAASGVVLARAETTQVFLNSDWSMVLTQPKFLREFWKSQAR
jgi:acyl-CoA thioester hydrolase